jgi:hypothetical protein
LVVGLAVAWMWVGRRPAARGPVATGTTAAVAQPVPRADRVVALPRWVPVAIGATCVAREHADPQSVVVDCTPGRGVVRLRYRGFASVAALRGAYAAASPRRGGDGPSGCARGAVEERAWSSEETPTQPRGRYRCSLAAGRANLVWSTEQSRVLAIASRSDGDLRSLYQWWTTVPGPTAR